VQLERDVGSPAGLGTTGPAVAARHFGDDLPEVQVRLLVELIGSNARQPAIKGDGATCVATSTATSTVACTSTSSRSRSGCRRSSRRRRRRRRTRPTGLGAVLSDDIGILLAV
jgi:hypothetical protein